jgi:LysR family transcriptional regulator of gallate degradation
VDPFDLNLRHLRALAAIVARGSMSAAAEVVSLSQPALTQGLAKLERQIGAALFDRRADGMTPTEAGLALAARADTAFARLGGAIPGGGRGFARPERLMTATQLRAFLALADAGSFVGAGAATGLSQPAIHRAVRDLEQVCGMALVERRGRGIVLSDAGRRLTRGVRLAAAEIAAGIVEAAPDLRGGRIAIGAMPLSRALLLPRAIARIAQEMPAARFDISEGSWRELVEPLRDGAIDMMIGALRDSAPDLHQAPLLDDRLVIVGRAGHPLAGAAMPSREALAAYPWIVARTGAPLRGLWQRLFADARGTSEPHAPIECGSVMVIRGILRDGDFLTMLSPDQVALEIDSGMLATVGPELESSGRVIGVTTRAGWRPTRVQARFLEVLGDCADAIMNQDFE